MDLDLKQIVETTNVAGIDDLALSPDGETLYAVGSSDSFYAFDLLNGLHITTIQVGNLPVALTLSPDGQFAYVVNRTDRTVSVVNLSEMNIDATVNVRSDPEDIVLSGDGSFGYVTNNASDLVSIIDLTTSEETSFLHTESGPTSIAVSNGTQLILPSSMANDYSTLYFGSFDFSDVTRVYKDGTQVHFNPDGTHDYTLAPDGRLTRYSYDANGLLETYSITAPGESLPDWEWEFFYTPEGKLDYIVDPMGRTIDTNVDQRGNLTTVSVPDSGTQTFTYDYRHLVTQHTDENGNITEYAYDDFGRIVNTKEPIREVYDPETGTTKPGREKVNFTPSDLSVTVINDLEANPGGPMTVPPLVEEVFTEVSYGRGGLTGKLDPWGYWLQKTDALSRTTTYERNDAGDAELVTYPDGDCAKYTYDTRGNIRTAEIMPPDQCALSPNNRDPNLIQSWAYIYEGRFNQIGTVQDPEGYTTTYVYDYQLGLGEAGNLVEVIYPPVEDENGVLYSPRLKYTYNQWGLVGTMINTAGIVTKYIFTEGTADEQSGGSNPLFAPGVTPVPGLLTQIVEDFGDSSHRNTTTTYKEFDGAGNPRTMIGPRGAVYTYEYDEMNRVTREVNDLGLETTYLYDPRGNLLQMIQYSPQSGRNQITTYTYDPEDMPLSVTTTADGITWETHYDYDINSKLARQVDNQGRTYIYQYDKADQLISITDPLSQVTQFTYTDRGEMDSQVHDDGRTVTFDYDARSNMIGLTPDSQPEHTFDYTLRDETATYTPPDVSGVPNPTTQYNYNSAQQLILETRPDGRQIQYVYDGEQRLYELTIPRGVYNYAYDPSTSQLTNLTAPDVVLSYAYDQELLAQTTWGGAINGSVEMDYDAYGRVVTETVNGGQPITFGYSDDHLLTQVGDMVVNRLPESGLLAGTTLGAVDDSWQYNPYREVAQYGAVTTDTLLYDVSYSYDGLGRIASRTETQNGVTNTYVYTYDESGRLTNVTQDGLPYQSYTYDGNGNRLSLIDSTGVISGTYDEQDRLLTYGTNVYTGIPPEKWT